MKRLQTANVVNERHCWKRKERILSTVDRKIISNELYDCKTKLNKTFGINTFTHMSVREQIIADIANFISPVQKPALQLMAMTLI